MNKLFILSGNAKAYCRLIRKSGPAELDIYCFEDAKSSVLGYAGYYHYGAYSPVFIDNYQRFLAGTSLKYQIDFDQGY